jgi:uncharacterized protein with von Willebrand factor type A (vWA) domain
VPEETAARGEADLAEVVAAFGHRLRTAGVPVTPERMSRFAQVVLMVEPGTVAEVYWLGRVTLLSAHAQIPVYDLVFDEYFRGYVDLIERALLIADCERHARPECARGLRGRGDVRACRCERQ